MRMTWVLVAALVLAGATAACAATRYGVVDVAAGGEACLIMEGTPLAPGTRLLVVYDNPQSASWATVRTTPDSACASGSLISGTRYTIALDDTLATGPDLGVAVLAAGTTIVRQGKNVRVRTPEARTPLRVATCASGEGIHLTVWRGARRLWHQYFYVGYDLEPDCTEPETRE